MGRGQNKEATQTARPARRRDELSSEAKQLRNFDYYLRGIERKMEEAAATVEDQDQIQQDETRAGAVKYLTRDIEAQKYLVRIAQTSKELHEQMKEAPEAELRQLALRARSIDNRAREVYMLVHNGFIRQELGRFVQQFDSESKEDAVEILRQEARWGVHKAIDRYEFDKGANPLTYTRLWILAEMREAIAREGRLIRLKAQAHDLGKKIEIQVKQMQNNGQQITATEIADKLGAPVEKVVEVLPWLTDAPVRLDAPISSTSEGEETFGAVVADMSEDMAAPVLSADERDQVRRAVKALKPFQRRVIELFYGLADNEPVEQKDLFDGVYRDQKTGEAFSAEDSVIRDRTKRGEAVTKRSQKKLNDEFKAGKLVFEPGTPEARELAHVRLLDKDYDPARRFEQVITREVGLPPTSGVIQEAKIKAEYEMSQHALMQGLRPRYRGDNELESSYQARAEVREALVRLGVVSRAKADEIKAGKSGTATKGPLRTMAEKHGFVDPVSGRLNHAALSAVRARGAAAQAKQLEQTDELADLMSQI